MSFISVFDVLGPNMIGPSSSHTAGAAAIALLAGKMPNAAIKKADFILYGSFARTYKGHGTRSEEHTSELQSHSDLVCRLLLEKKFF